MLSWFTPAKKKVASPDLKLNTWRSVQEKLLKRTDNDNYGFKNRKFKVPLPLAINFFLFYVTYQGLQDKVNYQVSVKALLQFIDFCYFNSKNPSQPEAIRTRISCGASSGNYQYYYTIIDGDNNDVLTASVSYAHTGYKNTVASLVKACNRPQKTSEYMECTLASLDREQQNLRNWYKSQNFLGDKGLALALKEDSSLDITFTESYSGDDSDDTAIPAPKSVREEIKAKANVVATYTPTPQERQSGLEIFKDVQPIPVSIVPTVEPIQNNNNAHNASPVEIVTNIDTTLLDEELKAALNEEPTLNAMLEPASQEEVVDVLPSSILIESEKEVLKEVVKNIIVKHHEKRSRDSSFDNFDELDPSTQRKLLREEARYDSRKRSGRLHTGPNSLAADRIRFDYREKTHDALGRQLNPNRSFRKQDDDYLDFAFYGFIREYGTIMNDIMKLPLGFDFNGYRRGSTVTVKALHFRNTFTHVTGTKASGRMILFYSEKEWSDYMAPFGRRWKDVDVHEILQKSVTMYAGDLEELEAADVFYNPTIMSQYDFKNVILGRQFEILYDYYVDLNTQAVKGIVGEDVESVDSIKTKWVKIDDLELSFFYDAEDSVPTRGCLGVLFMGDYFGGEIETNLTLRVFYNSN